jgi:hypothetical protein
VLASVLGSGLRAASCSATPAVSPATPTEIGLTHGGAAVRNVAGALWLTAAIAAARRSDTDAAADRLDRAHDLAQDVGRDAKDLAWAYTCRRHDADAVLALLEVERAAPDATRHNVYARSTISTLLGRARGSTGGHIRALATRNHVTL